MRRLIGWNDPVNATMIRAYLISEYRNPMMYEWRLKLAKLVKKKNQRCQLT